MQLCHNLQSVSSDCPLETSLKFLVRPEYNQGNKLALLAPEGDILQNEIFHWCSYVCAAVLLQPILLQQVSNGFLGFHNQCPDLGRGTVACIIVRRLLISVHKWQSSGMAATHEYWSQHDAHLVYLPIFHGLNLIIFS